jgi:ubiquinone/menaquinone biosynthesis C-methylase UbiE
MADDSTIRNPVFSRFFHPRFSSASMAHGQAEHRKRALAGLWGRVIEVGAGDGLNFSFYPEAVTEVIAVEPEDHLRELATEKAKSAPVPVRVVPGLADRLPAEDASVDAGVASLVLCSVPDQARALAELRRVIRPGGELRFYEHVRADSSGHARLQRTVDVVWPHLGGGCHLSRDTLASIERSGFVVESCDRFEFKPSQLAAIAAPHIIGVARRPPDDAAASVAVGAVAKEA